MRRFTLLGLLQWMSGAIRVWFGLVFIECVKPWELAQGPFLPARPIGADFCPLGGAGVCWGWLQTTLGGLVFG